MESVEIVKRAIEFRNPPRLPFFQHQIKGIPDDICDCWEMDRAEKGWFFGLAKVDDWGCGWKITDPKNMGQVVLHPLDDWKKLKTYRPPNPNNPFYFARLEDEISQSNNRYVVITSHFNLIERLHMLRGFSNMLEDFYIEPKNVEKALDMILEFKIELFKQLHKKFGDRIHGLFLTDDWGTQENTFISSQMFERFFLEKYRKLVQAIHSYKWHVILHSCGRINDFIPYFIDIGVDVLNMQQPRTCGISEIGNKYSGKICFLTTVDIQKTLPSGNIEKIHHEAEKLVERWSTPQGGFIIFDYGDPESLGIRPKMTKVMFQAFAELMNYHKISH